MCRVFFAASRLGDDVSVVEDVVESGSDVQVGHSEDVCEPGSAVQVVHLEGVQVVCKDAHAGDVNAAQHPSSAVQHVAREDASDVLSL